MAADDSRLPVKLLQACSSPRGGRGGKGDSSSQDDVGTPLWDMLLSFFFGQNLLFSSFIILLLAIFVISMLFILDFVILLSLDFISISSIFGFTR